MRFTLTTALVASLAAVSQACDCVHNGDDAGRWNDRLSPADALSTILNTAGNCYEATGQGRMCITGSGSPSQDTKNCLQSYADTQQSWHDDWFLWSSITCHDANGATWGLIIQGQ